jgi:hypothetical protein
MTEKVTTGWYSPPGVAGGVRGGVDGGVGGNVGGGGDGDGGSNGGEEGGSRTQHSMANAYPQEQSSPTDDEQFERCTVRLSSDR